MTLPLAILTIFQNARQQIVVSQVFSAVVAVLLGPGCLLFSAFSSTALPEYRIGILIGGLLFSVLLVALYFETRRRLTGADHVIQAFEKHPSTITRIYAIREKSNYAGSYRLRVELVDGSAETLPIGEHEFNTLINYLRSHYPTILKESAAKPER
jgi:hypothetical protein